MANRTLRMRNNGCHGTCNQRRGSEDTSSRSQAKIKTVQHGSIDVAVQSGRDGDIHVFVAAPRRPAAAEVQGKVRETTCAMYMHVQCSALRKHCLFVPLASRTKYQ